MSPSVYLNDRLVDRADARVSVFDHGLLYGDGVFESLRAYAGRIFRLDDHLDRLYASARAIRLAIPRSREAMRRAIAETLAANGLAEGYLRVIVTRGAGSLDLDPRKTTDPQVIVIADQVSPYPPELCEHGLRLVTAATRRHDPAALDPRIRSLSYQWNVLAKLDALAAGCLDAFVLDHRGKLAGSTAGNVFLVREESLHTPAVEEGVVDGITRKAVIELALAAGYSVVERTLDRYDVETAGECFLCATAFGLVPVIACDGRTLGNGHPGSVTIDLIRRFRRLVRGETQPGPVGPAVPSDRDSSRDRHQDHPGTD